MRTIHAFAALFLAAPCATALGQHADADAPTGSIMARALRAGAEGTNETLARQSVAEASSLFYVKASEPRIFRKHDLVQIVVRESSTAKSSQELETEKSFNVDGDVSAWPHLSLKELLELQLFAGRTTDLPALDVSLSKDFEGEGEYERRDDLTARLSAEVIEVLPNGNLILEARTAIRTDEETATMKVTGICRPDDVTSANTVLSSQVHDLRVVKEHEGELKRANEKGLITRVLDFFFAW